MKRRKPLDRKAIIFILICLILLIILCVFLINRLRNPKPVYEDPVPVETDEWLGYNNTVSDVYEGDVDSLEIHNKIKQTFEIYLPIMKDDLITFNTDREIENYYTKNEEDINDELCIKNVEEFKKLISELENIGEDIENINYCEFQEGSYQKQDNYEVITFRVAYGDDKTITFDAYIYGFVDRELNLELKVK